MITQIKIKNIALISEATIDFAAGLNIITGETGSGKSIILDALNLILGERADRQLIRAGEEQAVVHAFFEVDNIQTVTPVLEKYDIDIDDNQLYITRIITADGKNTCRVNGDMVPLGVIRELGEKMVDMHRQHQQHVLLEEKQHITILDIFLNEDNQLLKRDISAKYTQLNEIDREIARLQGVGPEGERKKDVYAFQLNEINEADVKVGEEEAVKEQLMKVQNAEKILHNISEIYQLLQQSQSEYQLSLSDTANEVQNLFSQIENFDTQLELVSKEVNELVYAIEDISDKVRMYIDAFDFSNEEKSELEDRLSVIYNIKRKYGPTIFDVEEYREAIQKELDIINNSGTRLIELEKQKDELIKNLNDECSALSKARKDCARWLSCEMQKQLHVLGIINAKFEIEVEPKKITENKYAFSANGMDQVLFKFSANEGNPLKALNKVASGGEVSRIMLALKTMMAGRDKIEIMIFDEIDVGISGRIAQAVGEKMVNLARLHQLICITHAPQISAMSDQHFLVEKQSNEHSTFTHVTKISDEQKINEIARLFGGKTVSELNIENAKELIKESKKYKNSI